MSKRILIVTSCSGSKAFSPPNQLTLTDFQASDEHFARRTSELAEYSLPAAKMYTGRQHPLILNAIDTLQRHDFPHELSLVIVSAGYGLLQANDPVVPYDITFASKELSGKKGKSWARQRHLTRDLQQHAAHSDLVIFLLGDDYLKAIDLPLDTRRDQTLVFLATEKKCPSLSQHQARVGCAGLSNAHAKQFSYPLVGLRGLLFERLAKQWLSDEDALEEWYTHPQEALDKFLQNEVADD